MPRMFLLSIVLLSTPESLMIPLFAQEVGIASAAPASPPNLFVSINEFTGSTSAARYIATYTPAGTRLEVLSLVPAPGGTSPTTERTRDLVLGFDNALYLFNGTFDPYLARFDLATKTWSQTTTPGWSIISNGTYGGIARLDQYIFVTDNQTGGTGDTPKGIIRFDTAGGTPSRFANALDLCDLTIGPDRILYALPTGMPKDTIYKYDPVTFASLGSVKVNRADYRGMGVAGDGSMYLADWSGTISRYSASGDLLNSLTVPNANFSDLDISPEGLIAVGTGFDGNVLVTDLSLAAYTSFRVTNSSLGGDVFVTWASVPEPSSCALVFALIAGFVVYQRKKTAQEAPNSP